MYYKEHRSMKGYDTWKAEFKHLFDYGQGCNRFYRLSLIHSTRNTRYEKWFCDTFLLLLFWNQYYTFHMFQWNLFKIIEKFCWYEIPELDWYCIPKLWTICTDKEVWTAQECRCFSWSGSQFLDCYKTFTNRVNHTFKLLSFHGQLGYRHIGI